MNQADVSKLVSKLNFKIQPKHRRLKNVDGPKGRILKLQKTLTALFKFERLELFYNRGDETRGYAERLISEALRNGPNKETMELADFWILEKQLVHKLFKVLVPRYENYTTSFTKLHKAPRSYPGIYFKRSILELKGNIYPSLETDDSHKYSMLHNVLLEAAKREYRMQKYKEMVDNLKD